MAADGHHSSDAASDVEKTIALTADSHQDTSGESTNVDSIVESTVTHDAEENAPKSPEGDATPNKLDRVPSQAQKLGKKKIAVIMVALCVCERWKKDAAIAT
jgi:hypothetical protein